MTFNAEMPEVYRLVVRTARKAHRCCECGGTISAGEAYNYHSGVWCGHGESFKVCLDCDDLRLDLSQHLDESEGIGFGNLAYEVGDFGREACARFDAIRAKRGVAMEAKR